MSSVPFTLKLLQTFWQIPVFHRTWIAAEEMGEWTISPQLWLCCRTSSRLAGVGHRRDWAQRVLSQTSWCYYTDTTTTASLIQLVLQHQLQTLAGMCPLSTNWTFHPLSLGATSAEMSYSWWFCWEVSQYLELKQFSLFLDVVCYLSYKPYLPSLVMSWSLPPRLKLLPRHPCLP